MEDEVTLRLSLVDASRQLLALGLNKGTSGNVSIRYADGFIITPSGVEVQDLTPESMVKMQLDGTFEAHQKPSSEWRFHQAIYQSREDANAIVHTHSTYATTLSTLRRDLPAFHYMVAVAGGDNVRCAPYALFGSQLLSDYAVTALQDRNACLLGNHGLIAIGVSLEKSLYVANELEGLCQQYLTALQVGEPYILTGAQMQAVHQQFKGYGALAKSSNK